MVLVRSTPKNTSRPLCPIFAGLRHASISLHPVRSDHGELVEPCFIWRLGQYRAAAPRLKRPKMTQNVSDGKKTYDETHGRAFWPWAFPIPTRPRIVSQSQPIVRQSPPVLGHSRDVASQSLHGVGQSPLMVGLSNHGPTGSCVSSFALALRPLAHPLTEPTAVGKLPSTARARSRTTPHFGKGEIST